MISFDYDNYTRNMTFNYSDAFLWLTEKSAKFSTTSIENLTKKMVKLPCRKNKFKDRFRCSVF